MNLQRKCDHALGVNSMFKRLVMAMSEPSPFVLGNWAQERD